MQKKGVYVVVAIIIALSILLFIVNQIKVSNLKAIDPLANMKEKALNETMEQYSKILSDNSVFECYAIMTNNQTICDAAPDTQRCIDRMSNYKEMSTTSGNENDCNKLGFDEYLVCKARYTKDPKACFVIRLKAEQEITNEICDRENNPEFVRSFCGSK